MMAHIDHHGHGFDFRPRPGRDVPTALPRHANDNMADLEFGDYGRSERFPSGWFVMPVYLIALALVIAIISWVV